MSNVEGCSGSRSVGAKVVICGRLEFVRQRSFRRAHQQAPFADDALQMTIAGWIVELLLLYVVTEYAIRTLVLPFHSARSCRSLRGGERLVSGCLPGTISLA